jgi:heptosyltransferase-2
MFTTSLSYYIIFCARYKNLPNFRKFVSIKKNILVIHTAFPGDIILSIPLLRALDKLFPNSKTTVVTTPSGKKMLENLSEINDFIIYDKKNKDRGIFGFLKTLSKVKKLHRDRNFYMAIIPHRFLKSALFAFLAGIKIRIGFTENKNFITSFFYTDKVKRSTSIHEIERNLSLLSPVIFEKIDPPSSRLPFSSSSSSKMMQYVGENYNFGNSVLIAPCSNWQTKAWPEQYFVKLVNLLSRKNINSILVASSTPNDLAVCSKIEKNSDPNHVINLAGQTSFQDLSFLASKAKIMVTNDSAPMHIGAGHNIPLIAIFGSTTKNLGFYPYSSKSHVIEVDLDCRPCGLHGKTKCPLGHFKCMMDISPEKIMSEVKKVLF